MTARLLLLLESRPLIGLEIYRECLCGVVNRYWHDFEKHPGSFTPIFLVNDIARYWRTLCVNYEVIKEDRGIDRNKRRVKNYKLKTSRLVMCYSTILWLLHTYEQKGTVTPTEFARLCEKSPRERLKEIQIGRGGETAMLLDRLLDDYDCFLAITNKSTEELIDQFSDDSFYDERREEATKVGDNVFKVIKSLNASSIFHRMLIV